MEKVGRRVRSSQPRVKGALWTAYMRVNYKPFHKYKHISFTRPYNIAPHTHAHARARAHTHTHTHTNMVLRASYLPPFSRISSILLALSVYHMHSEALHLWSIQPYSPIPLLLSPGKKRIWSLGGEDPLEESMAIHSSTLAWRIPWTERPGGLQSMGSHTVRHNWATNIHMAYYNILNIDPWAIQ